MLTILFFFNLISNSIFTGDISYEYVGWGEYYVDSTKFVIGSDFYFEKRIGGVLKKQPWLNSEFPLDISSRTHHLIYDNHVESEKLKNTTITTFYDFEIVDTVEYLGHPCKVVTFMLEETFSGTVTQYKYYYPLDLVLPELFGDIPKFLSNHNTIFRPFNEPFVPLYIEVYDPRYKDIKVIKATKIHKRRVDRKHYFDLLEKN